MATPYQFSPRIPVPPHPTPLSVTAYKALPNAKANRPPIHNPYDKFTQPEFDVWIGDITGALRRALGQIEADEEPKASERTQEVSTGNAMSRYRPLDLDESEDEALNDSFAEIKARRLLGKGKARDPREGPGLGGTDRTKPIEIVSSDEEEEHEVELAIGVKNDEEEEEENEEEEEEEQGYSEEEEEYPWKQGQSSSQQEFSPAKRRKYIQEESEGDDSEGGSEEDEEDPTRKSRPTGVIDIVLDDEDEMDDDGRDRGYQEEEERGMEELEEGSEGSGEEYYEEEERVRLGTSLLKFHATHIRTSRDPRLSHYADKEETENGPENVEDDDDIEEIQPPETNTVSPPHASHSPAQADSPMEIRYPWAGPRTYAEDHYKGGDVRPSPDTRLRSNHLSDDHSNEAIQDVTLHEVEVDGHVATSFSLHDEKHERPVAIDINGPQIHTEVPYTGADAKTHPGREIVPTLLDGTGRHDIGVPSASQTVTTDEQDYEKDPVDDEEQLEDDYDEEAVIQPPTRHTFVPTSRLARRALPIPIDAEFISIDDSDEETGLEDQESITVEPLEVVEMDEIVKEDTVYVQPNPPLDSAPLTVADIPIATWPLTSSFDQQDGIVMDYESLYANAEAVMVQPDEQAEVISTLVDWNYPPAFPTGIPTSAPGHLATPSSEERNGSTEESTAQALDPLINSPESDDKENSFHSLVHEEVMTQAEESDKASVENPKTLVDQATLSTPEPIIVEDSESPLTSQTLVTDHSSSRISSNDVVYDTRNAEHEESVMAEEVTQGHEIDVDIISEDVAQLVDENESAPAQQSSENTVDDGIESSRADNSIQEANITDVHGSLVLVSLNAHIAAANAEVDISLPSEGTNEQKDTQIQPSTSTLSMQIPVPIPVPVHPHHHTYDYDQLPTPPPDRSPAAQSPPEVNDGPSYTLSSPPSRHQVQVEEVEDEDDVRPQPFSAESAELDVRIDIESAGEPYTVIEPEPNYEYTDDDADGDGEMDFDVEVISVSSASQTWDEALNKDGEIQLPMNYVVEEPLTDGRLTEEPGDSVPRLGVVSFEGEESEAHHTNGETGPVQDVPFSTVEEPVTLDFEISSPEDTNIQPQNSSNSNHKEPTGKEALTSATLVTSESISSAIEHDVAMPVTAKADVIDPTSFPGTPSHLSPSLIPATVLDLQPQAQRQVPGDGLFTPADESTTITPASIHGQALDELAHVFFEIPIVSSTPVEELVPMPLLPDGITRTIEQTETSLQLPPLGTEAMHISSSQPSGNVHGKPLRNGSISTPPPSDPSVSMHVPLTRKPTDPILVSDPYPYSLSTPGISLMDPTEEDSEQDNSMSSNSTLEKDLEDKDTNSVLDDADELELQYPHETEILAELDVCAAAKASKMTNEAVDVDAHGDFKPDSAVAPLSSAEVQQADLPTGDNTVAPGLINGMEKNDVSPRESLPVEPAQENSSGDFPLTETANHDPPEGSSTPHNRNTGSHASSRISKRKRDSPRPPLEKVAPTTADKTEKGKNRKEKVTKLAGKGKAKATTQEIIDQVTSQTTIHVKPRRKTQSTESRALPKAASRSTSDASASATYRVLVPSSRSSSVASSVPSDQSVAVVALPSPTVHKPNVSLVQSSLQPVSLFHAHGQKRNNQNSQPQSSQARNHPIHRVISLPRINETGSTSATSPTTAISPTVVTSPTPATPPVTAKHIPSPAVRHAPAISSSPVTRSHCRYHRISLPKEEGGPRVCFLVPGCSLHDRELMAEEEIEDHGDATHMDSLRMIKDIQSLDFDSYLIGILRQLVGLDILREQEVFYLPRPGEEVVRKTSPRKERSGVFRGADSSSYAGSPGYSGSIRSPNSMKAPTSLADSTSTSLSAFRRRLDSEKDSASVYSDTELDPSDGEFPNTKRARPSPPDEQGGSGPMGPPLNAQGKRQLKGRRSRQIEELHEGISDDAQSQKKPSKPGSKRRRGSEITAKDDDEERLSKKLKIRIGAQ